MDIEFHGANAITLTYKKIRVVIDDNLEEVGLKSIVKDGDIALYTGPHNTPKAKVHLLLDHPGEYEVHDIAIFGIPMRAHMDEAGKQDATMFKVILGDVRVLVTGHVYPELSDRQLESIGIVDVMFVPVGGNGYTTDPGGALQLIKKISPKIAIPTHYADKAIKYPVSQQTLEEALHGLSMEPSATVDSLRLKASDLQDTNQLIVLNRQ